MTTAAGVSTPGAAEARERVHLHVYGDSLSMPRQSKGVAARDTYPERLQRRWNELRPGVDVQLYNRSRGGATLPQLFELFQQDGGYFDPAEKDVLVIQCGIVDCAPRPVPDRVRAAIGRLPARLRSRTVRLIHDNRARLQTHGFVWQKSPPETFRRVYERWVELAAERFGAVRLINIAPTTQPMERHSPGLGSAIEAYNRIIAEAIDRVGSPRVAVVDVHAAIRDSSDGVESFIDADDGHHITPAGHGLYAELLERSLPDPARNRVYSSL